MSEKYKKMIECRARKKKLTEARRELMAIEKVIAAETGEDACELEELMDMRNRLEAVRKLAEERHRAAKRAAMQEIERETNERKGKFWTYYCEGIKIERAAEISGISWGTAYRWLRAERRAR